MLSNCATWKTNKELICISFISGIFTYGIISYDILPGSLWHFYMLHFSSNIFAYGILSSGIFTAHLKKQNKWEKPADLNGKS